MADHDYPPVSSLKAALGARCPRCGRGRLFSGVLTVVERCGRCGLDFRAHDSGDGPAVFVILGLGIIVVPMAFFVDRAFAPPMWVHMPLWTVVIVVLALAMLRPMKAWLIAQQYKHRSTTDD